jgi:hypothetical protein
MLLSSCCQSKVENTSEDYSSRKIAGHFIEDSYKVYYHPHTGFEGLFGLLTSSSSTKAGYSITIKTLEGDILKFESFGLVDRINGDFDVYKTGDFVEITYRRFGGRDTRYRLENIRMIHGLDEL